MPNDNKWDKYKVAADSTSTNKWDKFKVGQQAQQQLATPADAYNQIGQAASIPGQTLQSAAQDFRKGNVFGGLVQGATGGLQALSTPFTVADAAVRQIPVIGPLVSNMARSPYELLGYLARGINEGVKATGIDPNLGLSPQNAQKANTLMENVNAIAASPLIGRAIEAGGSGLSQRFKNIEASGELSGRGQSRADIKRVAGPTNKELNWDEAYSRGEKYLAQAQRETPIDKNSDMSVHRQVDAALANQLTNIWTERVQAPIQRMASKGAMIDESPAGNSIRGMIDENMKRHDPKKAESLETLAKTFDGQVPIQQASDYVTTLNQAANKFYKASPEGQALMLSNDPLLEAKVRAAGELRNAIFDKGEQYGELGMQEARRDYGAVSQIKQAIERKIVPSERDPITSSFYTTPFGAAVKTAAIAEGIVNAPKTAALSGAAALARKLGIDRNMPGPTLLRAFERLGKTSLKVPTDFEPQVNIAGLLPPGSISLRQGLGQPGVNVSGGAYSSPQQMAADMTRTPTRPMLPPPQTTIAPEYQSTGQQMADRVFTGTPSNFPSRVVSEPFRYAEDAKAAGIIFNGVQNFGKIALPLFTDPITKTTFAQLPNETLVQALARKRAQFGVQ